MTRNAYSRLILRIDAKTERKRETWIFPGLSRGNRLPEVGVEPTLSIKRTGFFALSQCLRPEVNLNQSF